MKIAFASLTVLLISTCVGCAAAPNYGSHEVAPVFSSPITSAVEKPEVVSEISNKKEITDPFGETMIRERGYKHDKPPLVIDKQDSPNKVLEQVTSVQTLAKTPALKIPLAAIRLRDPEIREGHESVLTLAISTNKTIEELDQIISSRQVMVRPNTGRNSDQTIHSVIDAVKWSSYEFVKAKIWHCPTFVVCSSDDRVLKTSDDVLIWTFLITAKASDETQDGYLGVRVYGDHSPTGLFIDEISDFPALNPSIKVTHDLNWWNKQLETSHTTLALTRDNLLAFGAIFNLLLAGVLYIRSKRK